MAEIETITVGELTDTINKLKSLYESKITAASEKYYRNKIQTLMELCEVLNLEE